MSGFDKDDYLNDVPDAESLRDDSASAVGGGTDVNGGDRESTPGGDPGTDCQERESDGASGDERTDGPAHAEAAADGNDKADAESDGSDGDADGESQDTLTPLGKAKREAAEYLEALQRERAEFINYRNRTSKEQERFRQHGIIDVLTALLPTLDDIDRIREHDGLDDSFKAVAAKIDKAFEKFGVEKFGERGEEFDPTRHDAILHKPDAEATSETVDTVVEAGYRIGERVIRAARVVVASPQR